MRNDAGKGAAQC